MHNPDNRAALKRYAKGRLGAEAGQIVDDLTGDDDTDDEFVQAIKREPPRPPQGASHFGGPR